MPQKIPLSDGAIKEFTLECGKHFRLALCEFTRWDGRKIIHVIYVTDDKKTYVREIQGGRWVTIDNTQIGSAISGCFFFMEAERMNFIKWL